MKKIVLVLLIIIMMCLVLNYNNVYAEDITDGKAVIEHMTGTSDMAGTDNSIGKILNSIIGLLQVAGTGISVVVVTILGIKYLLATPSDKADTKKAILPILTGCMLLFGAVNLMAAVSDFAQKVLEE